MPAFFVLVFAYLVGSIPTGFILGSFSGVDVRRTGSGNVGATNVARVVGKIPGLLTLVGDVAKGWVPVFLAFRLGLSPIATCFVAVAAFMGHLYPVFLGFRGGKGVATALGIFLALAPAGSLVLISIFAVVVLVSRIVSLGSIVAAGLAPMVLWFFSYPTSWVGTTLFLALMIIIRHRENIRRLLSGTESKSVFSSR